jgi:hypothetical protein
MAASTLDANPPKQSLPHQVQRNSLPTAPERFELVSAPDESIIGHSCNTESPTQKMLSINSVRKDPLVLPCDDWSCRLKKHWHLRTIARLRDIFHVEAYVCWV